MPQKIRTDVRDVMQHVMIAGAGKIGSLMACLLSGCSDYNVHWADLTFDGSDARRLLGLMPGITTVVLDVKDTVAVGHYLKQHGITAVISSLPYFLNSYLAEAAKTSAAHYFDVTEDASITAVVKAIAKGAATAFVPQCGLAPGFISIVANDLIQEFDECHQVKLRVGALPQRASNALHYSLTWSTAGVINEYGNRCHALEAGDEVWLSPLEGLETLHIDGSKYEAFHTSGGLGSLPSLYIGKIQTLNYKTIRYPGHCEKMRFLMNDLKLNEDRDTLQYILERAIPKTYQDMVLIYVSAEGLCNGELMEKSYVKTMYPQSISGLTWSAIQVSTASAVCAVVDLVLQQPPRNGLVLQETFHLTDLLSNRFGRYYV